MINKDKIKAFFQKYGTNREMDILCPCCNEILTLKVHEGLIFTDWSIHSKKALMLKHYLKNCENKEQVKKE